MGLGVRNQQPPPSRQLQDGSRTKRKIRDFRTLNGKIQGYLLLAWDSIVPIIIFRDIYVSQEGEFISRG